MGLRAGARFGLAVFAACACNNAVVLAEELVRFGNVPVRVSQIQQRLAQERGETLRAAADTIEVICQNPKGMVRLQPSCTCTDAPDFRKMSA